MDRLTTGISIDEEVFSGTEDNNEEVIVQCAYEVKCSMDVAKECSPNSGVCQVHMCYGALSWCGYDAKNFSLWFK